MDDIEFYARIKELRRLIDALFDNDIPEDQRKVIKNLLKEKLK